MRDGTVLRTDVYTPDGGGPFPTLLRRTPYDKLRDLTVEQATEFVQSGYAVVVQDVRGRYASGGDLKLGFFSSDVHDAEDGYDTVEWAAAQPWSNGRVGTWGSSYDGWTQWALAHTRPPHLVTMVPGMIAANLLERELSGVLRLGRVLTWCVTNLSVDTRIRFDMTGVRDRDEAPREFVEKDRSKWLWYLPLADIPVEALAGTRDLWRSWLADHATDHFGFEQTHRETDIPVLSITGWYDQQIGTIKHFTGMSANGMTEQARNNQRLIIGPWTHGYHFSGVVGEVDFGPEASGDYIKICVDWFDRWLKDDTGGAAAVWPPIQLFVMGENRWREEQEWPLTRTKYTDYYLRSNGSANTPKGDGELTAEPPSAEESPDDYVYDPRDPVMTLYSPVGQQEPYDQRTFDGRQDILVYQTPPLEQPVEVTGPITVTLFAASSAPDTDWVVKLQDVWPSGFTQELCHGILRARYRDSYEDPSLLQPGEVYEFTITVNPVSNVFLPGHRIRVDITSSDFPNFDRNHNTGGNDYFEADLQAARQTVFHDAARPSRITLPVIPR